MTRTMYAALKWVLLALAVAAMIYLAGLLAAQGYLPAVVLLGFVGLAILAIYGTRRAVPLKYLVPGLLLLLAFQVWPIVYTAAMAFTNYGDGHLVSKEQSIADMVTQSVREVPNTPRYTSTIAVKDGTSKTDGELYLLLVKPDGTLLVGSKAGTTPLAGEGVQKGPSGKITAAPGYAVLNAKEANARKDLPELSIPTPDGGGIKPIGLSEAFEGRATLVYDTTKDTLTDTRTDPPKVYAPTDQAKWVNTADPSDALPVGWQQNVGLHNFSRIVTDPVLRSGFLGIFGWNVVFAAVSVVSTFLLGMLIALLFNDPKLRGKGVYRSLLILPYALPLFVTALVWRGMFNQEFGLINSMTGLSVDWLGSDLGAKVAILITNLWLGFPYMFLVTTGALQSIPSDVKEAAKIDGASPFRTLTSITMPLLLVAVGPLLIASFAFNFNNFGLIYLLTQGGPFNGNDTTIGSTDLLITYAFRLAFSGNAPNYGFAAAVSVVIFGLVALMTIPAFRSTKSLEEVN